MGYIGFDGQMDTNILIRTAVIKGRDVYFHAGGGIVADMRPMPNITRHRQSLRPDCRAFRHGGRGTLGMILVIDHYDSFVETLARYVREAGFDTRIINQDEMSAPQIAALEPAAIIFSPGPGGPETTGVSLPLIKLLAGHVPMLGVCLGHLAMAPLLAAR